MVERIPLPIGTLGEFSLHLLLDYLTYGLEHMSHYWFLQQVRPQ